MQKHMDNTNMVSYYPAIDYPWEFDAVFVL